MIRGPTSKNKIEANILERSRSRSRPRPQPQPQEIMHTLKEGKKRKKKTTDLGPKILSLEEKREIANNEEKLLEKQIRDLKTWTDEIESMNDEQLKEYLKNRPADLKTLKIQSGTKPKQKAQEASTKSKYTGIMASVLKFHKQGNEDCSASPSLMPGNFS